MESIGEVSRISEFLLIRIYNQVEKVKGENQGISKF